MPNSSSGETLGKQIRGARVAAELSLRELARRVECAPSYLNDIEHDRRVPSEVVLRQLAAQLNLDTDRLLAMAGRVGEGAEQYMRINPTAGVLFRRMSDAGLGEQELQHLLDQAEKMINKRDPDNE